MPITISSTSPLAHKLLQHCMDKVGNCGHELQACVSQEINTKTTKKNIQV